MFAVGVFFFLSEIREERFFSVSRHLSLLLLLSACCWCLG